MKNQKELFRAASFVLGKNITAIHQLTDEQLIFFESLDRISLIRCFALQELLNGKSCRQVANRFNIGKSTANKLINTTN